MTRESVVEKHFRLGVLQLGGYSIKNITEAGYPDRTAHFGEKGYLVELKTDTGRLSPIQKYRHRELAKIGIPVYTIWTIEQVDFFLWWVSCQLL